MDDVLIGSQRDAGETEIKPIRRQIGKASVER